MISGCVTFHLCYNKNKVLYLTLTKEIDYKNFSKVADLAVERVMWTTAKSPKFCETDIAKRRWLIHISRRGCVIRAVFERRRCLTGGTTLVHEIKNEEVQKMKRSVGIM